MKDIVLVTVDSVRHDYIDEMEYISSFETHTATTGGHYTRPSLASILSSSYDAAAKSRVIGSPLAERLSEHGYHCIGLAPSPQLDQAFGFSDGFSTYENFSEVGMRKNPVWEFLARFSTVRRVYHRLVPPHAKMDDVISDERVIKHAIERFNEANSPRFLWIHLIETHRPYGRGEEAISKTLDRKALFSPDSMTASDREEILNHYRVALRRADGQIRELRRNLDSDPIFVVASDHGDEFGEEGKYFHQPQRMRTEESIVKVPLAIDNASIPNCGMISTLDIAPTLLGMNGIDAPDNWDGVDLTEEERSHVLTIAPWNNSASVRFETENYEIRAHDAAVSIDRGPERTEAKEAEVPDELREQLRNLGYAE